MALACAVIALAGKPALAQGPQPAALTTVSVAESDPTDTKVVLTFAPAAPRFSVIVNDSDHPAIAFALSSRAVTTRIPSGLKGVIRAISSEQQETILILRFQAAGRVHLAASPVGDQAIGLEFTGVAPRRTAGGEAVAPVGPLPRTAERAAGEDGFVLVPLKYADVSEVVGLLTEGLTIKPNDQFTPREPAFGSAGIGGQAALSPPPAPSTEPQEPVGQSVDDSIGVDRRLNAIILKGSPERIARLRAKIAEIDVPVESVILETVFVELSENGARNVGLDFTNANGQVGVVTYGAGGFIPPGFGTEGGVTSASLQAAIYAQVRKGNGRIVSKPRIAAQSGSSAKIITGDALPILTAITLSGVNAVSQQVQYVNVGVTLQIAPRVSTDGFVTSHVYCVVSSVTGFSQGYPTISQRQAETSATVHDGETFVIGGLTQETELTVRDKVPGLGDVPLLGLPFRLHKGTRAKTELYIVVTPHVVRRSDSTPAPPLPPAPIPPAAG